MYMYFAIILLLSHRLALADEGCYSSIDTSNSRGSLQYGAQISCSEVCDGNLYPYVAMMNGGECFCLLSKPSSSYSTSSSNCNIGCYGYDQVMCGGRNAYTVFTNLKYTNSKPDTPSSSLPGTSSTMSTSTSTSSTSTRSTTNPTNGASGISSTNDGSSPTTTNNPSVTSTSTKTTSSVGSSSVTTPTTSSSPASPTPESNSGNKSSSKVGPIVGGVVAGAAAVALALGVVFYIYRRNSRDDDEEEDFFKKGSSGSAGSANVSRNRSKKINSVFDMPMANPFEHPSDDLSEKRPNNVHGMTDPRLNPVMMTRSRLSIGSLADETDYSRKILGVVNP